MKLKRESEKKKEKIVLMTITRSVQNTIKFNDTILNVFRFSYPIINLLNTKYGRDLNS